MHYIAPKSPARAKLAIHLHAQGMSEVYAPVEIVSSKFNGTTEEGIDMLMIDSMPSGVTKELTSKPYLVKNIRDFRSSLAVSASPQPVKDLSEFVERD